MKSMIFDPGALTPELMEERFAAATRPGVADNFPLRLRNMQAPDPTWQSLSEITNRTLVIWGRDDRTVTLDCGFIMLNQMPDVRLHVFSRCGHWAQWEKADEFNRLVTDFLEAM
jgi:pimeloyl-ACP methyl ester carboxylesterase